jgi:hypothetical protein
VPVERWSRRATNVFIGAYVVLQVALPLSYYLGLRPRTDERFAWRMFSTVRLDRCEVGLSETIRDDVSNSPHPIPLPATLQVGWLTQLTRKQPHVVDRFLAYTCKDDHVIEAKLVWRCVAHDGTREPPDTAFRLCRSSP